MKDTGLKEPETVFRMVMQENKRQLSKWNVQDRSPFEWLCYLGEEVGELNQAIAEHHYRRGMVSDVIEEAIQVATLSLKIADMYLDTLTLEEVWALLLPSKEARP